MRKLTAIIAACLLSACSASDDNNRESTAYKEPPPLPADAETVVFERRSDTADSNALADEAVDEPTDSAGGKYWGIKPGEPLPILWDELMPEGALDDLIRQQEEYLAALQKRYQSNATTLAEAAPFSEIEEGSELDYMPQFGSFDVVEELDGELIRIPGYVVPFDFNLDRKHAEFLFVPYMGACIHTPPPPPNQIIFVRADPSIRVKDIWAPYWLEGELSAEENINDLGDAAYSLSLSSLQPYPVIGVGP